MEKLFLKSDRLTIRNLHLNDLFDFLHYRSNEEIAKHQGYDVMNEADAKTFIEWQANKSFGKAGEWVQYGIEEIKSSKLIGDCAIKLNADDIRIAEIGITISHSHHMNGFAKEAMLTIIQFLFELRNAHRIVETVDAENKASIQLMKSIGFRQEGHFIENVFFKGRWCSEIQFALLNSEWEKLREKYF